MESVYQTCLCHELNLRKLKFRREVSFPVVYKNLKLESGVRLDLLVEEQIILELKAVETVLEVHKVQLLSYLRITSLNLGFVVNFNVPRFKQGIHRIVH